MFNEKVKRGVYNKLFSGDILPVMQPSVEMVFAAVKAKSGVKTPAAVARVLDISQQTLKNWERRGISEAGALIAQNILGLDANQLLAANVEPAPARKKYVTARDSPLPAPKVKELGAHTKTAAWPFRKLKVEQWRALTPKQRDLIENLALSYFNTGDPQSNESRPALPGTA